MAPQATCFPDLFFHQVRHLGDRVALRHKDYGIWNRISWKAFGQKVRDVASGLLSYGLEPGDRVCILGDNRPEWLICHLGAMTAGGVTCGIYPTSSPEEIEYVVEHSESKLLFVENEEQVEKVLQIIDNLNVDQVVIWDPRGLWGFSHPHVIFYDDFIARGQAYVRENPGAVDEQMADTEPDDTAMVI